MHSTNNGNDRPQSFASPTFGTNLERRSALNRPHQENEPKKRLLQEMLRILPKAQYQL